MHLKSGTAFPGPSQAQGWHLMPWLLWKLFTMPHCNYPNDVAFDFIKKTVWRYGHLPVGKFWKFGYDSSGFRRVFKPSQNCFGTVVWFARSFSTFKMVSVRSFGSVNPG